MPTHLTKLRAIGLDDEPAALLVLESLVQKIPFIHWIGGFERPTEAMNLIHQGQVDLIFLDVEMPDLSGLEVARLVKDFPVSIIFTTAYSHFALEGYPLGILDYLVKPLEMSRLWSACHRAWDLANRQQKRPASLFVKDGHDFVRVQLEEVVYIQSDSNLLYIQEIKKRIVTRMTLQDMIDLLPKEEFLRVHKSYIISLNHVVKLERHQVWVNQYSVPVASRYKEILEESLLKNKR